MTFNLMSKDHFVPQCFVTVDWVMYVACKNRQQNYVLGGTLNPLHSRVDLGSLLVLEERHYVAA